MRRLLLATAALLYAHAAEATTYYVSPSGIDAVGRGTQAAPFATPQFCDYQIHPGDTCDLMTGTYPPFHINHSGGAGKYITFQAAPGQHPIVLKNATLFNGISVEDNQSYITIQGLIVLGNAQSITLAQANASDTTNYTTNGACIGVPKTAHHINIINNTVQFCPGAGIIFWGDYGVIRGNQVLSNAVWSRLAESGMVIVGSNPLPKPGTILIYDNFVDGNEHLSCDTGAFGPQYQTSCIVTDGQGIIVDSNIKSPPAGYQGRIEIYNNIVYNNGGWGIVAVDSQHIDVYNNTTYGNGITTHMAPPYTSTTGGEAGFGSDNDVRVENNIFRATNAYVAFFIRPSTNFIWDYNITYAPAGLIFPYSIPTPTPIGPHDILQPPLFAGIGAPPQVFQLAPTSPAIGTGTPTLVPPTDFANRPRVAGSVDRGAYAR